MTFATKSDLAFMSLCITGNGPKVVSEEPKVRKQGNGNYTGFVRKFYNDGTSVDSDFIINARTIDAVRASYLAR